VKAKYIHDDGTQNRESQWHVAIHEQEDCGYDLKKENHNVKPRRDEGPEELRCNARWRRHGNKVKEPVEPERQKDETKQVPSDCRGDVHAHLLGDPAGQAIHIDVVSIDIDISDVGYTGEGFIFLWNAEKRRKRLTPCLLC
jgi:hypothetical protein